MKENVSQVFILKYAVLVINFKPKYIIFIIIYFLKFYIYKKTKFILFFILFILASTRPPNIEINFL